MTSSRSLRTRIDHLLHGIVLRSVEGTLYMLRDKFSKTVARNKPEELKLLLYNTIAAYPQKHIPFKHAMEQAIDSGRVECAKVLCGFARTHPQYRCELSMCLLTAVRANQTEIAELIMPLADSNTHLFAIKETVALQHHQCLGVMLASYPIKSQHWAEAMHTCMTSNNQEAACVLLDMCASAQARSYLDGAVLAFVQSIQAQRQRQEIHALIDHASPPATTVTHQRKL